MVYRNYISAIIFLFVLIGLTNLCVGAGLIYLDTSKGLSDDYQRVELACRLYGINLKRAMLGNDKAHTLSFQDILKNEIVGGLVISAKSLSNVNRHKLHSVLSKLDRKIPLLIIGLLPEVDPNILNTWSGGALLGVKKNTGEYLTGFYRVTNLPTISFELSGHDFLFSKNYFPREFILEISKPSKLKIIIQIFDKRGNTLFPIFASTDFDGLETYFLSGIDSEGSYWKYCEDKQNSFCQEHFFEVAPILMFLRQAFDKQCWHGVADYANLTIDDPFLVEPYGNLSYVKLLEQMKKYNFHSTIAFIPWNFDRNKKEVIKIFHENPDRFSISMHGNDHDHFEFNNHNIIDHETKIETAIARMDKFTNLTGIPYDKIMIFPHKIAPSVTIGLLKKYNFLATVNGNNIPSGDQKTKDPINSMRTINTTYENFPSFSRFSPDFTQDFDVKSKILIDLFLDNPVLLSSHHDLFEDGIDTFNKTAEFINYIQPNTKWRSLGDIVKHSYLERLRDDGNYDIHAWSGNFIIENTNQRPVKFFIRKDETFKIPITSITIDGRNIGYEKRGNFIYFVLTVPKGEKKNILIKYYNKFDFSKVDSSKHDIRVLLLRSLSDFRDIVISKNTIGRKFIRIYYKSGFFKLGLITVATLIIMFLSIIVLFFYTLNSNRKRLLNQTK